MEVITGERKLTSRSKVSYFHIMHRMLVSPGQFFGGELNLIDPFRAFCFLLLTSLFFTLAGLSLHWQTFPALSAVLFMNAVLMPVLTAGTGCILIKWVTRKPISFSRLFPLYALSSGLMMFIAWIPFFVWITEPWKWLLIGLGLTRSYGLSRGQSTLVIVLSWFLLTGLFWLMNECIALLRP